MQTSLNGIRVQYEITGQHGPWLVFSHSLACSSAMWRPQLSAFANEFRVLTYDVRGHGGTDAPPGDYTMDVLSADLLALLAHLDIRQCHFAGLSMGGMIGQTAALQPGNPITSLVLADTTGAWPPAMQPVWEERIRSALADGMAPFVEPALRRWFTPAFLDSVPAVCDEVRGWIRSTAVQGFVGACRGISQLNTLQLVGQLKQPTMVCVGSEDAGTPPELSHALHHAIPGSTLQEIPHASHLCNLEQPDAFNATLKDFLRRASSSAV